jgi:hypothetical protein
VRVLVRASGVGSIDDGQAVQVLTAGQPEADEGVYLLKAVEIFKMANSVVRSGWHKDKSREENSEKKRSASPAWQSSLEIFSPTPPDNSLSVIGRARNVDRSRLGPTGYPRRP